MSLTSCSPGGYRLSQGVRATANQSVWTSGWLALVVALSLSLPPYLQRCRSAHSRSSQGASQPPPSIPYRLVGWLTGTPASVPIDQEGKRLSLPPWSYPANQAANQLSHVDRMDDWLAALSLSLDPQRNGEGLCWRAAFAAYFSSSLGGERTSEAGEPMIRSTIPPPNGMAGWLTGSMGVGRPCSLALQVGID